MLTDTGAGYGAGYGDGDGAGFGFGSGYGHGYGDGSGYGDGHGYGDGDGAGDGDGEALPNIAGYHVYVLPTWGIVRIGCEIHTAAVWRAEWRDIAQRHGVQPTAVLRAEILAACQEAETC